jgi:(p)ppGpp synthase/HD superfamily hydrolase
MTSYSPRFSMERFAEALTFAARLHAQQTRKGSDLPYVSHLLGVAGIAMEYGGGEDECIAALLHDAAEDQGGEPTLALIRERFGDAVADTVAGCTDAYAEAGAEKPPWVQRKVAYIAHLRDAPPSVRLVSAADKLHNARSILMDYRQSGPAIFDRFKKDTPFHTLWYYRRLADTFLALDPDSHLAHELARVVAKIESKLTSSGSGDLEERDRIYRELDDALIGAGALTGAQAANRTRARRGADPASRKSGRACPS